MTQAFSLPWHPFSVLPLAIPAYLGLTVKGQGRQGYFQPFTWLFFRSQPSTMTSEMPPILGPSLCWLSFVLKSLRTTPLFHIAILCSCLRDPWWVSPFSSQGIISIGQSYTCWQIGHGSLSLNTHEHWVNRGTCSRNGGNSIWKTLWNLHEMNPPPIVFNFVIYVE